MSRDYSIAPGLHVSETAARSYTALGVYVCETQGAPPPSGATMKYWNGSVFIEKPLKRWSGSTWADPVLKRWNGSAWEDTQ